MQTLFFILSKLFNFIFSPYTWIFLLLIFAIFTKKPKRQKKLLIITFIVFYLFSNNFILDEVMRLWEKPPVKIDANKNHYTYVVVLGGVMSYYDTKNHQIGFNRSVDRLMQGIKMLNQKIADTLIFTGGDGSLLKTIGPEGEYIKKYLSDIGLDTLRIKIESRSQNTYENAKNTSLLLHQHQNKILLITSAFHMRRAIACFKKQGINVDYYPADRIAGKRKFIIDHLLIPQIETMDRWNLLIHEWIGYFVYWIVGYI
ncbi:MAG: YdcF family protein [Bacteroidales bacterium]|nr:YdcF family protein [Bacteroidales bacterium]